MTNGGARCGCRHRCTARIGKEVQNLDRTPRLFDKIRKPIPVRCLLGKKAGMLKSGRLNAKGKRAIGDTPLVGKRVFAPCTAAAARPLIAGIGTPPKAIGTVGVPNDLRIGAYKHVSSPPLKTFPIRGVQQFIVLPVITDPHIVFRFNYCSMMQCVSLHTARGKQRPLTRPPCHQASEGREASKSTSPSVSPDAYRLCRSQPRPA